MGIRKGIAEHMARVRESDQPVQPTESVAQVHVDENGYITEDPWTDADIDNLLEALEREPGDEQFATDAITVIRQLRAHPPTSEWNDAIEAAAEMAASWGWTTPEAIRALKRELR